MTRRNPFSAENAGHRYMGQKGGPTELKPGRTQFADPSRLSRVDKKDKQAMALAKMSQFELVRDIVIKAGTPAATAAQNELNRRGRSPDGVKTAWGTDDSPARQRVIARNRELVDSATTNPFSFENAGRRMKGQGPTVGPTLIKQTMQGGNPRRPLPNDVKRSAEMISKSTNQLVAMVEAGGPQRQAAIVELQIRGRGPDGIKTAWKTDTSKSSGLSLKEKFASGESRKGILKPAYMWMHTPEGKKSPAARFNPKKASDILFDIYEDQD